MTLHEQRAFFADQGYLIVADLLSLQEIAQCREEIARLHCLAAQLDERHDPSLGDFQREPFARDQSRNGLPVLRKIENTRAHSQLFCQLAAHPRLVAVVQELLGPDLLLFRSTLMLKPAFHGSAHGLHQDSAYWPMEPPSLVTVSIALDDSTPENGCFKVIPASHKWGLQQWGHIARPADAPLTERDDLDLSAQIDVPLKAGSALFFHSLLVHGSGPNKTPHSRNTALYAYFSPQVRYRPGERGPASRTFPVVAGLGGAREHTLVAATS
jgi:ectoine hydroxylase-related dioxygenase (phytanoyl-CoA dioxygenase family)